MSDHDLWYLQEPTVTIESPNGMVEVLWMEVRWFCLLERGIQVPSLLDGKGLFILL